MNINIELTLDQVNAILKALYNEPYGSVVELVRSIQTQANAQLQPLAETKSAVQ